MACVCGGWKNAVELLRADDGNGPALGLFQDAVYPTGQTTLAVGDMILLLTDGVLEVENPSQEFYDKERLLAAVSRHAQRPGPELLRELLLDVQRFAHSDTIDDDVCLVGMDVMRLG